MARRTLYARKIKTDTGISGAVADLGGTTVAPDGTLTGAANSNLVVGGGTGKLTAGGGKAFIEGVSGDASFGNGDVSMPGAAGPLVSLGVGVVKVFDIDYTDFNVASPSGFMDITVTTTGNDWIAELVLIRHGAKFQGGGITEVLATVGDAASSAGYIAALADLFATPPQLWGDSGTHLGGYLSSAGTVRVQTGSTIRVTLDATGGDLDELTGGSAELIVRYYEIP